MPIFSEDALRFLRGLTRHNDREWFLEHKTLYERELKEPMLTLIGEVNEAMLRFAPEHVRAPQKSLMRIYRDVRFSKDKKPYKTQVAAWWGKEGMAKTSGAGFYFSLSGTEMTIAAGVFMPDKEQLTALRRSFATRYERFNALLGSRRLRALLQPVPGNPLSRPPKGFSAESATALHLIRCRRWGLAATMPAADALSPVLARDVIMRFEAAEPVVAFLDEPLMLKAKRPLF